MCSNSGHRQHTLSHIQRLKRTLSSTAIFKVYVTIFRPFLALLFRPGHPRFAFYNRYDESLVDPNGQEHNTKRCGKSKRHEEFWHRNRLLVVISSISLKLRGPFFKAPWSSWCNSIRPVAHVSRERSRGSRCAEDCSKHIGWFGRW